MVALLPLLRPESPDYFSFYSFVKASSRQEPVNRPNMARMAGVVN